MQDWDVDPDKCKGGQWQKRCVFVIDLSSMQMWYVHELHLHGRQTACVTSSVNVSCKVQLLVPYEIPCPGAD